MEWAREYMGVPSPLTIGGWQVKVTERVHPEVKFKLRDGEIYFDHEIVDDQVIPYMKVNQITWEFLAKQVFRIDEHSFYRQRWDDMHPEQFAGMAVGIQDRARRHFEERERLLVVLNWMMERLYKNMGGFVEPVLERVHRIVCEANHQIARIIEPGMLMEPIQFRVINPIHDFIEIVPIHNRSFPHERFMEEFGDALAAWEHALKNRDERVYEIQVGDEPFPPDP